MVLDLLNYPGKKRLALCVHQVALAARVELVGLVGAQPIEDPAAGLELLVRVRLVVVLVAADLAAEVVEEVVVLEQVEEELPPEVVEVVEEPLLQVVAALVVLVLAEVVLPVLEPAQAEVVAVPELVLVAGSLELGSADLAVEELGQVLEPVVRAVAVALVGPAAAGLAALVELAVAAFLVEEEEVVLPAL